MKKIFTVLVAVMMIATSAMAQKNLKAGSINQSKLVSPVSSVVKKSAPLKHVTVADKFAQQAAAKATYNVVCTSREAEYYSTDNDWYILLNSNQGLFVYDIVCDSIVLNTVYTLSDMLTDYTLYSADGQTVSWSPVAATYQEVLDSLGHRHVIASMTDSTGDVYNLTYDFPARPDSFTDVNVTCDLVRLTDLTATDSVFQFIGTNDSLIVYIAASAASIPGTYYYGDILDQYTALYVNDEEVWFDSLRFDVAATTTPGEYDATAYIGAGNGIHYTITMNYRIPTADTTVNFTADNLVVTMESFYGIIDIYTGEASNDDYAISFTAYAIGDTIDGTSVSFGRIVGGDVEDIEIFSGSIVLTSDSTASGTLLGYDNVQYIVTLTGAGMEDQPMQYDATDEDFVANYTADQVEINDQYAADYGYFGITLDDGSNIAMLGLYAAAGSTAIPAGTYTIDDSEMEGTVVASPGVTNNSVYPSFAGNYTEDGINVPLWFMESGTVVISEDGAITVNAVNSAARTITITAAGNGTQSISNVENGQVSIYPNPATSVINVMGEGIQEVQIVDVNGRVALTGVAGQINISRLSNGVYFVRAIAANGISVEKIVKK